MSSCCFPLAATIAPELIIHSEYAGPLLTHPAVLVPLFISIVVTVIVVVLLVHHFRKSLVIDGELNLLFKLRHLG